MKRIWLPLASALALTACEVDAAPNLPGDDDSGLVINQTAALSAYPGASSSEVIPDGLDTRTTFAADASLGEVYDYFHAQLTGQGWMRTTLENDDDEVEADYSREGRELEFELERDDGGFELEIDIDGDNSVYDEDNGPGDDDNGADDSADDGADGDDNADDIDDGNDDADDRNDD